MDKNKTMTKNHNILFIEMSLNPNGGGVQRVTYLLGEEFRKIGCGVWYAYRNSNTDTPDVPEEFKLFWGDVGSNNDLYNKFDSFIKEKEIDMLICQCGFSPSFWRMVGLIKKTHNLKVISCRHMCPDMTVNKNCFGLTEPYFYIRDIVKSIVNMFYNKDVLSIKNAYEVSDRYILLSDRYIPYTRKLLGLNSSSDKLMGIRNPVSFTEYIPCKKENILLVVGRMEEKQKRISNILKIWKKLSKKYENWSLCIVGGGPSLSSYERKAKSMKLERCIFTGPCNNVREFYDKAKIFLMTSMFEGLPMTLIEAQNSGCVPIVFDNFAAVHDIIDGSNGIVVPSNHIKEFIASVEKLINNENLLQEMSNKAIASCARTFNISSVMELWYAVVEELDKE